MSNETPRPDLGDLEIWHSVARIVDTFNQQGELLSAARLPEVMALSLALRNPLRRATPEELDLMLQVMGEPVKGLVQIVAADILADAVPAGWLSAAQQQRLVSLTRKALTHREGCVRAKGMKLARALHLPDAKSLIEARLRDPDPLVRQLAQTFLGYAPPPQLQ